MTLIRRRGAALAVLPLLLTAACGNSDAGSEGAADESAGPLQVVSTVAPITSIVANIVGDKAEITGIVPEGTNSHTFEPPPKASAVMEKADVVFVNGLQLEEPTFELAKANAPDSAVIVKVGDQVLPESEYLYDFSFPKEDGKPNPHLWTDPTYGIKYADVVLKTMSDKDPDNTEYYQQNHDKFVAKATPCQTPSRPTRRRSPPAANSS